MDDSLCSTLAEPGGKQYVKGTHRAISPAETLARVSIYMPSMGITRLANVTGLDRIGIPVFLAIRPNSRSLTVSQGKGLDTNSAKVSALMESVESYHAEHIQLPLRTGSVADLDADFAIVDCDALPGYRGKLFTKLDPIIWIEAVDICHNKSMLVPYELVHTRYTVPAVCGDGYFLGSSNGLASGNSLLEATIHALCEIVERDAYTSWCLKDEITRERTRLDEATIDDPDCRELLERCWAADVDVAIWNITSDVGLPAFTCTIVDRRDFGALYAVGGMGCHPDRTIALTRALTEAAQGRLTLICGTRDDVSWEDYESCLNPLALNSVRLLGKTQTSLASFQEVPSFINKSLNQDIEIILHGLAGIGLHQVLVVDLTMHRFMIPVVRAIVPGLEGLIINKNYRPGARARSLKAT